MLEFAEVVEAPCAVIVYQSAGIEGRAVQTVHLFANREAADKAFEHLRDGMTKYHERANDRERVLTVDCINGPTAIDISTVVAVGVDDAMDETAFDASIKWGEAIRKIREASGITTK